MRVWPACPEGRQAVLESFSKAVLWLCLHKSQPSGLQQSDGSASGKGWDSSREPLVRTGPGHRPGIWEPGASPSPDSIPVCEAGQNLELWKRTRKQQVQLPGPCSQRRENHVCMPHDGRRWLLCPIHAHDTSGWHPIAAGIAPVTLALTAALLLLIIYLNVFI